jgi:hypothetical protein
MKNVELKNQGTPADPRGGRPRRVGVEGLCRFVTAVAACSLLTGAECVSRPGEVVNKLMAHKGELVLVFNATTLISRRLGRKAAFFAPFLTLNHFDFS